MSKFKRYERYKDSGVEWIGEIPEHWICCKLGYLLNKNESGTWGDDYDDDGVLVLRSTEITLNGTWSIVDPARRRIHAKEYERCLLYEGDLLLTKSSGSEQHIGKTVIVDDNVANMNCVFSNFIQRLRTDKRKLLPKYLYYFLNTNGREQLFYLSTTTTGLKNLSGTTINSLKIQLPTIYEQIAIASFLDQKTAEIDSLIADKEELIELLQEKRQAMITEAVTKGLNPNVRMKDSGIKCIGEMPEQWNIRKIKYLANIRNVKAGDSDIDKTYIGLENIESETGKLLINRDDEQQLIGETANIFKKGDVLFGKLRPYLAKCIIADFDGRCTSELLVLRTTSNILPEYLYFFMLSPKFYDVVNSSTYGAKMPRASWDFIGNLEIPLPSIKEQKEIVEYLVELTRKIDDLVFDINTQIQKLKEYRQSLIFEAVTGKIDVRDYADN